MLKGFAFAIVLIFSCVSFCTQASLITITAEEIGNDVVFNVSGSVDLTNMNKITTTNNNSILNLGAGYVVFSPIGGAQADFYAFSGESLPVFTLVNSFPTGHVGDIFGFSGYNPIGHFLALNVGYQSGTSINITSTFAGENFNSMGLISGSYSYTFANNTAIFDINASSVPEPSSLAIFSLALLVLLNHKQRIG